MSTSLGLGLIICKMGILMVRASRLGEDFQDVRGHLYKSPCGLDLPSSGKKSLELRGKARGKKLLPPHQSHEHVKKGNVTTWGLARSLHLENRGSGQDTCVASGLTGS